jgi:DNA-binding transcriptional regulator YiaG
MVAHMSNPIELVKVRGLARSGAARLIREGAGLSLGEVARAVGVAKTTVFRWERGDRRPRGDKAIAYGQLLTDLMTRDQ